jgi:hypothetical protein
MSQINPKSEGLKKAVQVNGFEAFLNRNDVVFATH